MPRTHILSKIHYERGEDHFWEEVRARQVDQHPSEPVGYDWNRLYSEAPSHKRSGIRGLSILRFERGEFPLSTTKLGSNFQFIHGWEEWVNKLLKNPTYVKLPSSVGILDVVAQFSSGIGVSNKKFNAKGIEISVLEYPDQKHDLVALIIFWLARHILPGCPDDDVPMGKSLSKTSKVARFSSGIGVSNRKFNAKGIEIALLEYPDHKHDLVALIIFWLARHILPGCPDDGSIYKRLDLYQLKIVESAGRYKVLTNVDAFFIQMCLWERFGTCTPVPNACLFASVSMNSPLSRNNYRAWAWHDQL
ncbi:Uncharacterized protein TCM_043612 [Theobroma cacao]|uniref:Aminotransferase-like plant mobile domain-containing protein n=1 Tax=Theobroma cacao TaxID=3641 RepID=A0A061FQ23_THECC|nr:Uncharacterized protein TCM_043612 [Theobroma cacao]